MAWEGADKGRSTPTDWPVAGVSGADIPETASSTGHAQGEAREPVVLPWWQTQPGSSPQPLGTDEQWIREEAQREPARVSRTTPADSTRNAPRQAQGISLPGPQAVAHQTAGGRRRVGRLSWFP